MSEFTVCNELLHKVTKVFSSDPSWHPDFVRPSLYNGIMNENENESTLPQPTREEWEAAYGTGCVDPRPCICWWCLGHPQNR